MSQKVARQTLYEEVWADPIVEVAKRYGLSDVGFAKLCRSMGIPVPPRGYWAKVRAGAQPKKTHLPMSGRYRETATLTRYSFEEVKALISVKEHVRHIRKAVNPKGGAQIISGEEHPLVHAAREHFSRSGMATEKGLISAASEVLNIEVTIGSVERALSLVNALLLTLATQDAGIEIDEEKRLTVLTLNGTRVELRITEKVSRREHVDTPEEKMAKERYWKQPYRSGFDYPGTPRYDYFPTGILTISAGRWPSRSWNDTARTRLESRLPEVIAGLVSLSLDIRDREEQQARKEEVRRIAREKYEATIQARKSEREALEQLDRRALDWERANRLRSYLSALETHAQDAGSLSGDFIEWLAWGRAKADWIDPLIQVSDPILDAPEPQRPGYC